MHIELGFCIEINCMKAVTDSLFISLLCSTAVIHIKAHFLTSSIFKSKNPS